MTASLARILASARRGDTQALAHMRGMLGTDRSQADPHYFEATSHQVLIDTGRTGPQFRHEVFEKISPFIQRTYPHTFFNADSAIAGIKRCPPLEKVFLWEAYSAIGLLEAKLVTDESLTRAERVAIHRQIKQLSMTGQPCWVNWVKGFKPANHGRFDLIVDQWMHQPIVWSEAKWFDPVWKERLWGLESATAFFKKMDPNVRVSFGIKIANASVPDSDRSFEGAFLEAPIEEANRLAELLGVKFRFRSDASTPAPRKRRSKAGD